MKIQYRSLKDLKITNSFHQRVWRSPDQIACYFRKIEDTQWFFTAYLAPLSAHFFSFNSLYPNFWNEESQWQKTMTNKDDRMIQREFRKIKCPKDQILYRGGGNSHFFCFYTPEDQVQRVIRYFEEQAEAFGEDSCLFHQIDEPNELDPKDFSIFNVRSLDKESEVALQRLAHEIDESGDRGKSHRLFGKYEILLGLNASVGAGLYKVNDALTPRDVTHWTPNKILTPSKVYIAALVRLMGWCDLFWDALKCLKDGDDLAAPKWGEPNAFYHYREELLTYKQEMETRYPILTKKLADFAD